MEFDKSTTYGLKGTVTMNKYKNFMADFQVESDDRRLAYNLYTMILNACKAMQDAEIKDPLVVVAVDQEINAYQSTIDKIIKCFNGVVYENLEWEAV